MKKSFKKILSVMLSASFLLACAACTDGKIPPEDEAPEEDPFTDSVLVDGAGKTKYKIVIPEQSSQTITVAANELQLLFSEATGQTLQILSDEGLVYGEEKTYLSIGRTTVMEGSGVTVDYAELGSDGFRLETCGNTVVMAGAGDNGSLYAVYEFLERTFRFETYAADEYYIDTGVKNLNLKEFHVKEIPTFSRRSVGLFSYSNDATFRNRMRQERYDEGWIYWSHSYFKILPKETYFDAHSEWYGPSGTQLCLTNDKMREEFTRVVIDLVRENPDCGYIMLGQEDNNTVCDCTRCLEAAERYKNSGVMMRFVNRVADDVQAYLDENEPGRVFYLGTFAYQQTTAPPVDTNNRPIDKSVIPHDNVMIMVAPIYACNSHSFDEPCNAEFRPQFEGWKNVAEGHLFFWIYNKVFNNYFIPFNNFSTLVENYEILQDLGTRFVYHQGNKETPAGGMEELKCYVEAKLMWDVTADYETLVDDFIVNYYKDAAPYYREYYDLIRINYAKWDAQGLHCYNSSAKSEEIFDSKYWTQYLLDRLEDLFGKMLDSISGYQTSDPDLYETLALRIRKEQLTVRYLYLELHFDALTYEQAKAWIDEFEIVCSGCSITVWREMYLSTATECLISSLVGKWRTALNQK